MDSNVPTKNPGDELAASEVNNIVDAVNSKQDALGFTPENITHKNAVNGYAGLNASGKIADAQLPSRITIAALSVSFADINTLANNWQEDYYDTYGNGNFKVQFKDEDGNLQDQPIFPLRIIDRSGDPIQTGITLDTLEFPDGQLIIYYSNEPLI